MNPIDYWKESVESALEDIHLTLTESELSRVASDIMLSHETYEIAFPLGCGNSYESEISVLRRKISELENRIPCKLCNGEGRIIHQVGTMESNSQCNTCRGEGWTSTL